MERVIIHNGAVEAALSSEGFFFNEHSNGRGRPGGTFYPPMHIPKLEQLGKFLDRIKCEPVQVVTTVAVGYLTLYVLVSKGEEIVVQSKSMGFRKSCVDIYPASKYGEIFRSR